MVAAAVTRPMMRYHGGKFRLAPWIIAHFPAHRVYVEPFGGAGSVLLRKPRSYAEVYNDLDGEIVNLFRVLRDPAQARELERLLRLTPFARAEFEAAYLSDGDPIEQARRTLIKSFMGFSSNGIHERYGTGFRANTTRPWKTPAGDWAGYPDLVASFTRRLQGVVIENRPALDVIRRHDNAQALHYVDPPYPHETRQRPDAHRYALELTADDHRELASVLREAHGMVVISGYPCDLYDNELYPDWQRVERTAFADGARRRTEVLWLSPAAFRRLGGTMLFPLELPTLNPWAVPAPAELVEQQIARGQ